MSSVPSPVTHSRSDRVPANGPFPEQDKVERYGWQVVDKPGVFQWVVKSALNVDHDYQRTRISAQRVNDICSKWSWVKLAVLSVARRPDGSLWVFDGQHRKLAADKRSDIHTLPCLIYDVPGRSEEASGFLAINTNRGPVRTQDKFNALIMAKDPVAVAVQQMVDRSGYRIVEHNQDAKQTVRCVGTLMSAMRQDPGRAESVWDLCVYLHDGACVVDRVYATLFYLEWHMQRHGDSLHQSHNLDVLARIGLDGIHKAMAHGQAYHGGGAKAAADGLVQAMNKGRRTRKIPSPYVQDATDGHAD